MASLAKTFVICSQNRWSLAECEGVASRREAWSFAKALPLAEKHGRRAKSKAKNILSRGLSTVGHTGTWGLDVQNAWGEDTATQVGEILLEQVTS